MAQTQALATFRGTLIQELQEAFTLDKLEFIRKTAAPDALDGAFATMLYKAWKYRLDPLNNEIYCMSYNKGTPRQKDTIYTGLAGLLNIAHQTGKYGGLESDVILDDKGMIVGAWATAWRTDSDKPTTARVRFNEYTTGQNLWESKPARMIQKCAECAALRAAFNISGLYDRDEMGNADVPEQEMGRQTVVSANASEGRDARAVDASTGEVLPNKPTRAALIAKVQRLVKDAELSGVNVPPEPDYTHTLAKELIDYGLKVQALLDEQAAFLAAKPAAQPTTVS